MIRIYFKPSCDLCKEAKDYLNSINMQYEEIDLSIKENRDARSYYRSLGIKNLPVIVHITDDDEETILYGWNNLNKEIMDDLIKT